MNILTIKTKYNEEEQKYFMEFFTKIMNENKYVSINNEFILSVTNIYVSSGGCGHCKIKYDGIHLHGLISTPEDNYELFHNYDAAISSWYIMCEKFEFIEDEPTELLLKCLIDRNYAYIYDYFINKNSVEIINDIEIWKENKKKKTE